MKRILTWTLILSMSVCSGCSGTGSIYTNYREIEEMQLIRTIGFDRRQGQLVASISGGQGGDNAAFTRMSAPGSSIIQALDTMQEYTSWQSLYYAHTEYGLIGQELARTDGLREVLDYLERSPLLRSDLPLFVVRQDSAENLMLHCTGSDREITSALDSLVRDCERRGDHYVFTLRELISSITEHHAGLLCAVRAAPLSQTDAGAEPEQLTPIPWGYAIFKDTALVGFLDSQYARGVSFLMGHPGSGAVTLEDVGQVGTVVLSISGGKTALRPVFDARGDLTGVAVDLTVTAFAEEVGDYQKLDHAILMERFSRELESWVMGVLEAMQTYRADFLGLGAQLRLRDPAAWDAMPRPWLQCLPELEMQVQAHCRIARMDLLKQG